EVDGEIVREQAIEPVEDHGRFSWAAVTHRGSRGRSTRGSCLGRTHRCVGDRGWSRKPAWYHAPWRAASMAAFCCCGSVEPEPAPTRRTKDGLSFRDLAFFVLVVDAAVRAVLLDGELAGHGALVLGA